jgi:hypothetical protein
MTASVVLWLLIALTAIAALCAWMESDDKRAEREHVAQHEAEIQQALDVAAACRDWSRWEKEISA